MVMSRAPERAFSQASVACSRLQDGGERSISQKKCGKRGGGPFPPPFPSRARLIFALLVLKRPHYTIWSLAQAKASDVNNHIAEHQLQGRRNIKSTGTLRYVLRILQTTNDDSP